MKTAEPKHVELLKDGILTYDEAAELLRVDKRTVERMVEEGQLPRTRVRSSPRIPRSAIMQYLSDNVVEATG